MSYAQNTSVSVEKSQVELERLLIQYGASQFYRGATESQVVVGFRLQGRNVKLTMPVPKASDFARGGKDRAAQAARARWRALVLSVKAKLVGVDAGVESFEEAFLAHVVTPDGRTVHEQISEPLSLAYKTGKMPPLLPGLGETSR